MSEVSIQPGVMHQTPLIMGLLAGAVTSVLAAQPASPPKELTGKLWLLQKLDQDTADPTIRSTVSFAPDGKANGATGCNRWFGAAQFDGSTVRFSQVGTTRMACPKPQMDRETAFTRMLGLTRSWTLGGGDLSLSGEDGSVLAVFRPEPTPAVKK